MNARLRPLLVFALVGPLGLAAGCGTDDSPTTAATRTVNIEMRDIAYSPDSLAVEAGETVRFVFTNVGAISHDAFIGNDAAQEEHEQSMSDSSDGGMSGGHDMATDDALTVAPGETGEITYTFDEGGEIVIGCHQPGHFAAGMRIAVDVA